MTLADIQKLLNQKVDVSETLKEIDKIAKKVKKIEKKL